VGDEGTARDLEERLGEVVSQTADPLAVTGREDDGLTGRRQARPNGHEIIQVRD
jgi:hypothetical protein